MKYLVSSAFRPVLTKTVWLVNWYRQVKTVYKKSHVHQMLGKVSTNTEQNRSVATLIAPIGQWLFIVASLIVCGIYFLAKSKALHSLEELRSTIPALSLVKTRQKSL